MELDVLEYTRRTPKGTGGARRLRREGLLPGILYGHKQGAVPVALDKERIEALLRTGQRTVTLEDGPRSEMALLKDVQYDALGTDVIHVDFARVDPNERVRVMVPIELHGAAKGAAEGGVVDLVHRELRVECRVAAIPEVIRAEIAHMEIDQSLHVGELGVPDDVTVLDAPDTVIVVVHPPRLELTPEEETEAAAEEEAAEPEVIGREEGEEAPAEEGGDEASEQ